MELGLTGRRAIVTGGSKGIGQAIAGELLAEGAAVTICSRHADELETAAAGLMKDAAATELVNQASAGTAGTVLAMPCDVTDPGQATGFIDAATAAMGGLDILVNNAGRRQARPVRHADRRRLADRHRDQAALTGPLHPRCSAAPAAEPRAAGHQHQRRIRALSRSGLLRDVGQPGFLPRPRQGSFHGAGP
jgi:NAD(P)-dependent dehydrogenase (short-subunit alcohol dehydrogenase family)